MYGNTLSKQHPSLGVHAKFEGTFPVSKNLRVPQHEFPLGGPDHQMGGPSPNHVGALSGHPQGTHNGEKTVSISATVNGEKRV